MTADELPDGLPKIEPVKEIVLTDADVRAILTKFAAADGMTLEQLLQAHANGELDCCDHMEVLCLIDWLDPEILTENE